MPISTRNLRKALTLNDTNVNTGITFNKVEQFNKGKSEQTLRSTFEKELPLGKFYQMDTCLQEISNLPSYISIALATAGFVHLKDLQNCNAKDILSTILPPASKTDKGILVEKEIVTAWVYCLCAHAKNPKMPLSSWREWLSKSMANRLKGTSSKSLESLSILTRSELIRQRQSLHKTKGPLPFPKISFNDLKAAKTRLNVIPAGKALEGKLRPETLVKAKKSLRKAIL